MKAGRTRPCFGGMHTTQNAFAEDMSGLFACDVDPDVLGMPWSLSKDEDR